MIRPARPSDAEAITALEDEAFGADAWSQAQVEAELNGATRRVLAAEADGQLVGYGAIACAEDVADLTRIVVSSSHRRSGVASELLAALHDAARGAGAMRMLLEVAETNVVARAFYEARGYVEISVRRGYYRNGDDAVVLARALG